MLTRRGTQGQSLVEFALVFPILMLLVFGVIDGARLVYTNTQLGQAAREGARVAAVEASSIGSTDLSCVASESLITPARPGAHVCPINEAALKADVVAAVKRMSVGLGPFSNANVFLACDSGDLVGDPTATPPIPVDPAPTGAWTEIGPNPVTYPSCAASGDLAAPNAPKQLVSVRITYQYTPITPIAGSIFGSVNLSASATMIIN
jgi:TadE-like protein